MSTKQAITLAEDMLQLEAEVESLTEKLDQAKKRLNRVKQSTLPELMEEMDLTSFTLADGTVIGVEKKVSTHISEANQAEAMAWLRRHKLTKIIRHEFKALPSTADDIRRIRAKLDRSGVDYKEKPVVHHSTLKSLIAKRLEEGKEIPTKLFGYHEAMVAKARLPKKKKQ